MSEKVAQALEDWVALKEEEYGGFPHNEVLCSLIEFAEELADIIREND